MITWINPIVKKIAIGSLLPDSNSSNGLRLFLRLTFFDLNTLKTAAASVEEIIAPKSKPYKISMFSKSDASTPKTNAEIITPIDARLSA